MSSISDKRFFLILKQVYNIEIDTVKLYVQVCSLLSMRIKLWKSETDIIFLRERTLLRKRKYLTKHSKMI